MTATTLTIIDAYSSYKNLNVDLDVNNNLTSVFRLSNDQFITVNSALNAINTSINSTTLKNATGVINSGNPLAVSVGNFPTTQNTNILNIANTNILNTANANILNTANVNILSGNVAGVTANVTVSVNNFPTTQNTNVMNIANTNILNTANVNILSGTATFSGSLPSGTNNIGVVNQAPYTTQTALGYQQITNPSSSSLTIPTGATYAYIQAEGNTIRWRDDGTAPTTTVGMPIAAGQAPLLFAGNLSTAKFTATTTANLNISYYK
jgi:hypothetical protein